jgi:hypothetical protein
MIFNSAYFILWDVSCNRMFILLAEIETEE